MAAVADGGGSLVVAPSLPRVESGGCGGMWAVMPCGVWNGTGATGVGAGR